jgi:hypothetical protein
MVARSKIHALGICQGWIEKRLSIFDPHPYSEKRGTCRFYEKDDHIFQELNIVSRGD